MLLWATAAAAQPATLEQARRDLGIERTDAVGFHAQGFAQLSGGATDAVEGDVALGGELRLTAPRCDLVRVGGQARLGWREGAQPSAEQWASFCIPLRVFEVGHHFEWDVRPSLLAPLGLRQGTNRRETLSVHFQPVRFNLDEVARAHQADETIPPGAVRPDVELRPGDLVIFEVWSDYRLLWSATSPLSMQQTVGVAPFRYIRDREAGWGERRDFIVDVGSVDGTSAELLRAESDQVFGLHLWGLHVQNLALGSLYATGGIGIAGTSAGERLHPEDPENYDHEVDLTTPRALLAVETGDDRAHGHVRATHDATAVIGGFVTVDSRLAAGGGVVARDTKLAIEGTVARTTVHIPKLMPTTAVTGGVSLTAAHRLSKHLQATLLVDVARSFYAPEVSSLDFRPRWGMQVFGTLQAAFQR